MTSANFMTGLSRQMLLHPSDKIENGTYGTVASISGCLHMYFFGCLPYVYLLTGKVVRRRVVLP